MTRSSIVAAVVVTLLFGLLIWWRDQHPRVQRTTEALMPPSDTIARAKGTVTAVPAARFVSPGVSLTIPFEGAADAGAPD
jgi:hypothetical protein